jgi:ABC-type nickel/cobalt efflux system permease component RcnA
MLPGKIVVGWLITGIVPCPAVALIVFFCLLNGLPGMALAGALVIGIGMAVTNIAFGFAAILLRRGFDAGIFRLGRFANFANYGISLVGGAFIVVMGIFLYWGTL